jgi:hypothetical protein
MQLQCKLNYATFTQIKTNKLGSNCLRFQVLLLCKSVCRNYDSFFLRISLPIIWNVTISINLFSFLKSAPFMAEIHRNCLNKNKRYSSCIKCTLNITRIFELADRSIFESTLECLTVILYYWLCLLNES